MVPVAAKAGALLTVAAAGSTSIWYFSDSIFGVSLVSIADETPSPTYGNTSIGKNYSKYFLSSKNNKKTWEARHKEHNGRFSGGSNNDKAKDKFSTVTSDFSTADGTTTSLNKICEDAYKETTSGNLVDENPTSEEATKFFKTNVWEFCGLGKIVTLDKEPNGDSTVTYGEGKIGGDSSNKKLFVSTKVESNDWFWNLKTEEFWANTNKVTGEDKTKHELKKLAEDASSSQKKESIKKTCQAIYEKDSSGDSDNKNKEDALTFCSISLKLTSVSS